jgi:large subunit ribosomal protein L13
VDTGDFVIVVNAGKVRLTGSKAIDKTYASFSGYPGGLKKTPFSEKLKKKPTDVIRSAVWGMLPKNKLSQQRMRKLKVYAGAGHPHEAQKPEPLDV